MPDVLWHMAAGYEICRMEQNSVIIAPQCRDVPALLSYWKQVGRGGADALLRFLTVPSAERDAFLMRYGESWGWVGSVLFNYITPGTE